MNKIPFVSIIINFTAKTPQSLISLSHVNQIFRETIEFYTPQTWERFVTAASNSPERKIAFLHCAAKYGIEWIVRKLLFAAYQVDVATELKNKFEDSSSALMMITKKNREATGDDIVDENNNPVMNRKRCDRMTELQKEVASLLASDKTWSSTNKNKSLTLRNLLYAKESRYAAPTLGYTILMSASYFGKSLEVVKTLLEFGANISSTDLLGKSSVELACEGGNHEILELLLQQKDAKVNGTQNFITGTEVNPLRVCILYNRVKCAEVLIQKFHCDLSHVDNIGRTMLYQAARQGCVEIVKMIVEKCPKKVLFIRDPERRMAIDAARDRSHDEIVKILEEAMTKATTTSTE